MFSQKPKLIRLVASDGLTNIYKRRVSLNIYEKGANKFGIKVGFKIENESQDQNGWWVIAWTSSKWGKIWLSN